MGLQEFFGDVFTIFYQWINVTLARVFPNLVLYRNINNQTVLITGATSDLGKVLAYKFAKQGNKLVLLDKNENELKRLLESLKDFSVNCVKYVCDFSRVESVKSTIEKINQDVGTVNILIYNSFQLGEFMPFVERSDESIESTFRINVLSQFYFYKAFLPKMMEKNEGHIVLVSGLGSYSGLSGLVDYCSSKFAGVGLLESLRLELRDENYTGIKLTEVSPLFLELPLLKDQKLKYVNSFDLDYISDRIITAIVRNEEMVIIPDYYSPLLFFKGLLPVRSHYYYQKMIGITDILKPLRKHLNDKPLKIDTILNENFEKVVNTVNEDKDKAVE